MKLPKNTPALKKKREEEKQELESRRQATNNTKNVAEWRESIEARVKAIEDKLLG